MENESLGNEKMPDPREQLKLGAQAAERAVTHVVAPWWAYLLTGIAWMVLFAVTMLTKWFWLLPVGIAIGVSLVSWLKTRASGVRISAGLWRHVGDRGAIWIVGAVVVATAFMMAGIVGYEFLQSAWVPWVAGALSGAVLGVAEWQADVSVRASLRGDS